MTKQKQKITKVSRKNTFANTYHEKLDGIHNSYIRSLRGDEKTL